LKIEDFLEVWAELCTLWARPRATKEVPVKLQRREVVRLSLLV
jgi:hypothetical protein